MSIICEDCPSPNACRLGVSCEESRSLDKHFSNNNPQNKRKETKTMANNTPSKLTVTPADVAKEAEDKKLTTEVPAQKTTQDHPKADSSEKATGEKAKEVVEETAESAKKTVKDRVAGLIESAKNNKKFFYGVVTGALSTAVVLAIAAKDKVEEVVSELEIADEADPEVESTETTDENAS